MFSALDLNGQPLINTGGWVRLSETVVVARGGEFFSLALCQSDSDFQPLN